MHHDSANTFPALHALSFDEMEDWQKLLVRDYHLDPREILALEEGDPGCLDREVKEAHEAEQRRRLRQFRADDAWGKTAEAAHALMPPEEFALKVAWEAKLKWFNSKDPKRQRLELRKAKKLGLKNLDEVREHFLKHYDWVFDLRMALSDAMLHDAPVLLASVAMVRDLEDRSFMVAKGYVLEGDRWVYGDREWLDLKEKLHAKFGKQAAAVR